VDVVSQLTGTPLTSEDMPMLDLADRKRMTPGSSRGVWRPAAPCGLWPLSWPAGCH